MSGRADPLFKLRLPDHLRAALEKEAEAGRRSLTAEILGRLEMSFSDATQRLGALEKVVNDGNQGNEALAYRVHELERDLENVIDRLGQQIERPGRD